MVSSTTGAQAAGAVSPISIPSQSAKNSTNSFAQQLAASLESYLNQAGIGSGLEIDINPTQSQNSGERQFTVTIKDPSAMASNPASPAAAATVTTNPAASSSPATPNSVVTVGSTGLTADFLASDPYILMGPQSSADTYWAAQPPAVQQLRDIPDTEGKIALGSQLAQQGYKIDPQIMLYGWNPAAVMKNRQDAGYTWVPSFSQASILVPPGMTFPGLPTYDPNNPPAGSIRVTTDFSAAT
jgi:hypothetical protein